MENVLVVVDMQNDFINGALGSEEATKIVPKVVEKIKNWEGPIFYSCDCHFENNYLNTTEGKHNPVKHCIMGTVGCMYNQDVDEAIREKANNGTKIKCIYKENISSVKFTEVKEITEDPTGFAVEIIGLHTDTSVLAAAAVLKYLGVEVTVDTNCCCGTSTQAHWEALKSIERLQVNLI